MTESQPPEVGGNPDQGTYKSTASLAAALAVVQSQLPRIGKHETGTVSGETKDGRKYSYEYSYADLASVSAAIFPLLGANGLAFTAFPTRTPDGLVLRYALLHASGERMTGEYPINGTTAQQLGGAITYARRYCLCAVTGIAPDEDDDKAGETAARETEREQQRAEQVAVDSQEYTHAANAVQGAWAAQVGEWNEPAARKAYHAWSKGGELREADARSLRAFAAYLSAMPRRDAGGDPVPPADEPVDGDTRDAAYDNREMTGRQRGQLFVLLGQLLGDDKAQHLRWVNKTLGTEYESRTQINRGDAGILIDALKAGGVTAPAEESEAAQ